MDGIRRLLATGAVDVEPLVPPVFVRPLPAVYCRDKLRCAVPWGLCEAGGGGAAANERIRVCCAEESWLETVDVSPRDISDMLALRELLALAAREGMDTSPDGLREGMKRSSCEENVSFPPSAW